MNLKTSFFSKRPKQCSSQSKPTSIFNVRNLFQVKDFLFVKKHFELGHQYFKDKKFEKALECFNEVIEVRPTALAYYNRALIHLNMDDLNSAFKDLFIVLKNDNEYKDDYYKQGIMYFNAKLWDQAALFFKVILENNPNDYEVLKHLGMTYHSKKNYYQANKYYALAMQHEKADLELTCHYAKVLIHFGVYKEALVLVNNALIKNPLISNLYTLKIDILKAEERHDEVFSLQAAFIKLSLTSSLFTYKEREQTSTAFEFVEYKF